MRTKNESEGGRAMWVKPLTTLILLHSTTGRPMMAMKYNDVCKNWIYGLIDNSNHDWRIVDISGTTACQPWVRRARRCWLGLTLWTGSGTLTTVIARRCSEYVRSCQQLCQRYSLPRIYFILYLPWWRFGAFGYISSPRKGQDWLFDLSDCVNVVD